MTNQGASLLGRFRQPEYTGENRCTLCTIVNVLIAAIVSGLLAVAFVPLGIAAFTASLLMIYVRGYLVPGTPALTKRYMPDRLHRLFGTHPLQDDEPEFEMLEQLDEDRENEVEQEAFLTDAGVIEPGQDDSEYVLTEDFVAAIERHADRGTDDEAIAKIFGVDPDEMTNLDRDYPAVKIGIRVRKWPSEAALLTDVVTHTALAEQTERWADVPAEQRVRILEELRGYHDRCLSCGGKIEFSADIVESCCGQHQVKTYACADCGQHLREFDQQRVGSEAEIKGMTP